VLPYIPSIANSAPAHIAIRHAERRDRPPTRRYGVCWRRRVVVDQCGAIRFVGIAVTGASAEQARVDSLADKPDDAGPDHDQREWHVQREDQQKRERCNRTERRRVDHAAADAVSGEADNRDNRRFDAGEHRGYQRHVAIRDIDPRQHDQQDQRRQHEQSAGDQPAPRPVQQPADVRSELLRLRSRQHHAVVERVQETPFGDPSPPLHQFLMHDGDLSGRSAETDEAELQPEARRLRKSDFVGALVGFESVAQRLDSST
jgi:hypothetical protein